MMFSLIILYWSAMDSHSKRKVLEIFNMNYKNVFFPISFLKPTTNLSMIYDF